MPDGPAPTTSTLLARLLRRRLEAPAALERLVAEKALDRVDADGGVDLAAVAGAFAACDSRRGP